MQEDPAPEGGGADKMQKRKRERKVKIIRPKCDLVLFISLEGDLI